MQKEEKFLINLKFVPQVTLLSTSKNFFKFGIDVLLKKIVCQNELCSDDNLCSNCQKIKDNNYFDLTWYKFNKNNMMKKQDVINIMNNLSYQSIENKNSKICVIEEIEYSSVEASNSFLKFLENLPDNTFLIFTSKNIDKVLPTIKSRCQIINLSIVDSDFGSSESNLELVKSLVNKFIINDNNKKNDNNFFLIKEILALKDQIGLFFQFLLKLTQNKIVDNNSSNSNFSKMMKEMLENWKNNDQLFLINLIEVLSDTINRFTNTKNINLNLLLNHFFITIYQGQENEF